MLCFEQRQRKDGNSLINMNKNCLSILSVALVVSLAGCTIEPLNATRQDSRIAAGAPSETVQGILAATEVDLVSTRTAQQVRNKLLFAMNGGRIVPGGQYRIKLNIEEFSQALVVETDSRDATSAQISLRGRFAVVDKRSGKTVHQGLRQVVASYDRTSQSFANQRARRDAQNRAAENLAQQIRLDVGQAVTKL